MAPVKDFYQVLGVAKTASADELKKAYRKLAKRLHPDVNGGDKAKTAQFKELTEAYEVLGDEKKRAEYDQMRDSPFAGFGGGPQPGGGAGRQQWSGGFPGGSYTWSTSGAPGGGGAPGFDPSIFEQFFRGRGGPAGATSGGRPREGNDDDFGDMFGDAFAGSGTRGRRRAAGGDVEATLEVDLPTAALGGKTSITLDVPGRGRETLTVKIPAGVKDGAVIRLAGKGQKGQGGPDGDLLLTIRTRAHPQFTRSGDDLSVDVPVAIDEAVLGGKVPVPLLEGGTVSMTVPAGTSSGAKLRLRGKGAAKSSKTPDDRGDLYARIMIHVPKVADDEAADLIRRFAKKAPANLPR